MPTINLNERQLDVLRRAMLDDLYQGLIGTAEEVDRLRQKGDLNEGPNAADVRGAIKQLHRELDALDALGWYDSHPVSSRADGDLMAALENSLARMKGEEWT